MIKVNKGGAIKVLPIEHKSRVRILIQSQRNTMFLLFRLTQCRVHKTVSQETLKMSSVFILAYSSNSSEQV